VNALNQTFRYIFPMGDKRTHAFRIEHQVQHIARTFSRSHVDETIKEAWRGFIGREHVPVSIHHQCRERFMLEQNTA
jgi:hypothetical protein